MKKSIYHLSCDWKEMIDPKDIEDCVESLRESFPNNKIYFYDLTTYSDSFDILISIFDFNQEDNDGLVVLMRADEEGDFPIDFNLDMLKPFKIDNIGDELTSIKSSLKKALVSDLYETDEKLILKLLNDLNTKNFFNNKFPLLEIKLQVIKLLNKITNEEI